MTKAAENREAILIIDDEPQIRTVLCEMLADGYDCQSAGSAEEGLELLRAREFALVVSDVTMAGISGLEMVPQILSIAPDTVVVMMSGAQTIETAVEAMRVGAFDYLMKPFDLPHVEVLIRRAVDHHSLLLAKRHYESQLEALVQQRTTDLLKTTEALKEEIAERNRVEERLNYLAYYDVLTTLPNRILFKDRLSQALMLAQSEGQILAVLILSLDRFKNINDTLGPAMADRLVGSVAERLKRVIREGDTLGYWGSDEFVFLLRQLNSTEDAMEIAGRIQSALQAKLEVDDHEFYVTASIGIGLYPFDGLNDETLMKNAGAALFQAKASGGNSYQFYTADMNARAVERHSLENSLRRAIEREEFIIHYQPIVDVNTLRIVAAEALVRWQNPELGLISPARFIPLAEDTGLIVPIGEWVLRTACKQMKQWHFEGFHQLVLSVNLSGHQFRQQDLSQTVVRIIDDTGFNPKYLELELTESSIMTDAEFAVNALRELKDMGIKICIDDFGTGFSSLGYLKRLPIDILKIDQSFVRDLTKHRDDASLVMAIITLAHNLRLKVIAEGVETEEQLKFLQLLGCDEIQGYLFSMPVPAEEFKELLPGRFGLGDLNDVRRNVLVDSEQKRLVPAA